MTRRVCITVLAILIPVLLHADCLDQLASQELRGRLAGTSEVERAACIIADGFADQGLVAWPERLDMYHHFVFRHCTGHGRERLAWSSQAKSWNEAPPQMFVVLDASSEAEVEGPLVWAGFGLGADSGWDDWRGLDARDAIVIICSGEPPAEALDKSGDSGLRSRIEHAREAGARGVLLVADPFKPVPVPNDALDCSFEDCGLPVFVLESALADSLLGDTSLKFLVSRERRTRQREDVQLENRVKLHSAPLIDEITGHNVLAAVPNASDNDAGWILLTAHHDHEGLDRDGFVLPGADDNASGVCLLMDLAGRLAGSGLPVLFASFDAEEQGLIGSRALVSHGIPQLRTVLNFDMVGRLRNNRLYVPGGSLQGALDSLLHKAAEEHGLSVESGNSPELGGDHLSFTRIGVPALHLFTGTHEDYNRPSDTADRINREGLRQQAAMIEDLCQRLYSYTGELKAPTTQAPRMEGGRVRVAIGIIPSFTGDSREGLLIKDVRPGSPAEEAGLLAGDLIVAVDGVLIANIYDYTHLIRRHKAGDQLQLNLKRGDERLRVHVLLGERQP